MRPSPYDLFGEIPVTENEVHLWVSIVAPHIFHSRWRVETYVIHWNVVDKIRRCKLSGEFYGSEFEIRDFN